MIVGPRGQLNPADPRNHGCRDGGNRGRNRARGEDGVREGACCLPAAAVSDGQQARGGLTASKRRGTLAGAALAMLLVAVLVAPAVFAQIGSRVHEFRAGEAVLASKMNENFDAVLAEIDAVKTRVGRVEALAPVKGDTGPRSTPPPGGVADTAARRRSASCAATRTRLRGPRGSSPPAACVLQSQVSTSTRLNDSVSM